MGSWFAFFWNSMHRSDAFEKQLGTAATSCFSTILSSSSTTFSIFASLWWLKICRFPLGFSLLLKSGRFWLELCEEVMEDHIKNNNFKKQLGTAVPSWFFKVNLQMFSIISSLFFPASRFFVFSAPLASPRGVSRWEDQNRAPPQNFISQKHAVSYTHLTLPTKA